MGVDFRGYLNPIDMKLTHFNQKHHALIRGNRSVALLNDTYIRNKKRLVFILVMGSSASIPKTSQTIVQSGKSTKFLITTLLDEWFMLPTESGRSSRKIDRIDSHIIRKCEKSWNHIHQFFSQRQFSERFFHNFERTDAQTCALLKPSSRSMEAGNCRHSLLVYVIQFCLSITDLTLETKKKLRSLGRRHVLRGFTR